VGVVVAVAVLASLMGVDRRARLGLPAAAALTVVLCAATLSQSLPSAKDLKAGRGHRAGADALLRAGCNGGDPRVIALFAWARSHIPKGTPYYYVQGPVYPGDRACAALGLLPAVPVEDPKKARYLVIVGASPAKLRRSYPPGRLMSFGPNLGIVTVS
jgi:hypothetical protein